MVMQDLDHQQYYCVRKVEKMEACSRGEDEDTYRILVGARDEAFQRWDGILRVRVP